MSLYKQYLEAKKIKYAAEELANALIKASRS
jgi:hypothetical protein